MEWCSATWRMQAGLMTVVSVICDILAFNVLRPKYKIIYEPKVKYHVGNKRPPRISDSVFGWIPLVNANKPELVDKIGLDTVAFFRFLRMFRYLFSFALLT
ncbi:hypothetical protein PILCRDRAFT_16371 [Piloderma croceum F 1598]|uniref:CSC1/OSCA1-like N-terminal transmembrane domain-containing protein n=1 Tax=Piloderma croceum (strain F 1598) TaxID=765440 RepID=A0A0C3EWP8_PILCF|nr:hypothetical protein PILCRDRAFT_16371 [Piloderma croceum F 1598]